MTIDPFWIFRFEKIVAKAWFDSKMMDQIRKKPARFIIMCHGCPSHPYDENPALIQKFLKDGFILVYPDYIGTWGSYGKCNFENAVDTILNTIDFLRHGKTKDIKSGEKKKWKVEDIILMGGSFGGSAVLVAGAKSKHIKRILAASPVTDWRTHNKLEWEEEDLMHTWTIIKKGLENYWRADKKDYMKLIRGELDLNPIDYVDILKNKDTFLLHGIYDKEVNYMRSKNLHKQLISGSGNHQLFLTKTKGHIVLRHLSRPLIYKRIVEWL